MYTVTTTDNRILSTHSTRKKALAAAKKAAFTKGLTFTKVLCDYHGKLFMRTYFLDARTAVPAINAANALKLAQTN